jgi:hypothetical protein
VVFQQFVRILLEGLNLSFHRREGGLKREEEEGEEEEEEEERGVCE